MLDIDVINELEGKLKNEFEENLTSILTLLNREEKIEEFLNLLHLEKLLKADSPYKPYSSGKIIVIGQSQIKEKDIYGIAKDLGISKERLELYLEYYDAKTYNFNKTQYNSEYSLILVGPMPHSGVAKGDFNSIITKIKREEGFPPVIKLEVENNNLKITKSSFKKGLILALERAYIK